MENQGYELVPFTLTNEDITQFRNITIGLLGNYTLSKAVKVMEAHGESPIDVYKLSVFSYFANPLLRSFIRLLLKLAGNGRIVHCSTHGRPLSQEKLDDLVRMRDEW